MKCESTAKHSLFLQKIVKIVVTGCFFLFLIPYSIYGQMFSVGDESPRFNTPQTEFYIGFEPTDVTYTGNSNEPESAIFAFRGPVLRLGYNSSALNLSLATGGKVTGLDDVSYFEVGGYINTGFNLYQSSNFLLQLPVRITSRFTNITNSQRFGVAINRTSNRFRFGSLTAGAGAQILARPAQNFRMEAAAVPGYGFSFASGGLFGGSLASVVASGRLYFDRLFGDTGLSLGYKYDFRNYDVDEEFYDYKIRGHSIQIGITF